MKQPAIYIITNKRNGTLYTGVTSNLIKRAAEHRSKFRKEFSSKYNCALLIYYEIYDDMEQAILREEQIKAGSRKKKLALIEGLNPNWKDLYHDIST